ncbi:MAG: hypothetical protein ABWY20_03590 [Mycobacterium sp.]
MTAPARAPSSEATGLLGRLMVTVRNEFRSDLLEFGADDPVFGTGCCRVAGCERHCRGQGLCQGHRLRWVHAGRPDLDVFAATTDARWHRLQPNQRCRVDGCGYGVARRGLCALHARYWLRAGRPELDSWLHNPPAVTRPEPGASCRIPHCALWPQAAGPFCLSHANTWKVNGRPDIDEFARRFTDIPAPTDELIRFDLLDLG